MASKPYISNTKLTDIPQSNATYDLVSFDFCRIFFPLDLLTVLFEMNKEHIRFYILTRFKLGLNATDIHRELCDAWKDSCIPYRTVANWVHEFREGRQSIEDAFRPGRPVTETSSENIETVRQLIELNPHISIRYIVAETDLTYYAVQTIIVNYLKLKKLCSRWVPHFLTEEQKKERVKICTENLANLESGKWRKYDVITGDETWLYLRKIESSGAWVSEGGSPSSEVRRSQFEPKSMFCVFFMTNGPVLIHQVPRGQSINGTYYQKNCLEPLVERIKSKRPSKGTHGIKLHFDNAPPHKTSIVNNYLAEHSIAIMPHPVYSPDLAPCDFWLFGYLKQQLKTYSNDESLKRGVTEILEKIPKEMYRNSFENWIERMKLCIQYGGDYFEHLM